jgi:putative transposase
MIPVFINGNDFTIKFGGMSVSDAVRLKALEDENKNLKRLVAELNLDKMLLTDVLSKNW